MGEIKQVMVYSKKTNFRLSAFTLYYSLALISWEIELQ